MTTEQLRTELAAMCTKNFKPTGPQFIARLNKLGYPMRSALGQLEYCIGRGVIRVTNHRRLSVR